MAINKFICGAIFYSCQALAIAAIPTPDNFMNALSDDIKLRNLSLLGSHDAGTYGLDPALGVSPDESGSFIQEIGDIYLIGKIADYTLIKCWSQAQSNDITIQLNHGVRYFDLRIAINSQKEFRMCHGLYGPLFDDVLSQLSNFLNQYPSEMIFLDFQHLFDQNGNEMTPDQQSLLIDKLQQSLGSKIAPSSYGVDVTLGQMRQAHNQVIIFWENATTAANFPALLWDRATFLCSTWYNVTNWNALQMALNQGIATQPQRQFYVNQAVLTPDATMIITHLFSSLLSIEAETNTQVMQWYKQKAAEGTAGNILMIDNEASAYEQAFQISWGYNNHLQSSMPRAGRFCEIGLSEAKHNRSLRSE
jgi:glycosylphosphatidylinositol diacylglycerol-lyase